MRPIFIKARLQLDRREQKRQQKKLAYILVSFKTIEYFYFETISFKVMKTIRWQMKTSNMFIMMCGSVGENSALSLFNFLCG